MANFIINSTETKAIRKSEVAHMAIVEKVGGYELWLWIITSGHREIIFETDTTEQGIQSKATTVLATLET